MDLKPIKPGYKPKSKSYKVCDIESMEWTKFLVIGLYDGDRDVYFEKLREFFAYLFIQEEKEQTIFAHFGGKFDFAFLLQECLTIPGLKVEGLIPRGSGILCFDLVEYENQSCARKICGHEDLSLPCPKKKIAFIDSSAILPFGLGSLAENFKVAHNKKEWNHKKTKGVTPELIEYLRHDLLALYEVIATYREWPLVKMAGAKTTMASQAVQVLRLFLPTTLYSLNTKPDIFVRGGYFGGRTEVFKPYYHSKTKPITCWDVNSLYPTVMRNNVFPNKFLGYTSKYDPDTIGFYNALVEVPTDMYVPPLGTVQMVTSKFIKKDGTTGFRQTPKYVFPTGMFWGRWSTMELEYAKSIGVKVIKTGRGAVFSEAGFIFKDFIDHLYRIRLTEKEEGRNNSPSDILAKLLMNSCYGRMGLNRARDNLLVDDGSEGLEKYATLKTKDGEVDLMTRPNYLGNTFSNVSIAASVTSYSRIHMHKIYMQAPEKLFYTDTDSLFTTQEYEDSPLLGGLKKEYSAMSACFLLPKTYIIQDLLKEKKLTLEAPFTGPRNEVAKAMLGEDFDPSKLGENTPAVIEEGEKFTYLAKKKIVMKGFDSKKILTFTEEDFHTALEGDLRRLKSENPPKFATFKTAAKKGVLVTMKGAEPRQIRSLYDKRTIYRAESGEWDTKPLVLNTGKSGEKSLIVKGEG